MHGNDYLWELILGSFPFRWIVGKKVAAGSTGCVVRSGSNLFALKVQNGLGMLLVPIAVGAHRIRALLPRKKSLLAVRWLTQKSEIERKVK